MTLIVATVETDAVWVLSDTALTDPKAGLRDREYMQKIEPSLDRLGLVAFAGDFTHGSTAARNVSKETTVEAGLNILKAASKSSETDFLFARHDGSQIGLWKVSKGAAKRSEGTDHIGDDGAFGEFQRIRHGPPLEAVQKSVTHYIAGLQGPGKTSDALSHAILTMLLLFASRNDRTVGGWPLAYVITSGRVSFCSVLFSTSDPFLDQAPPGTVVPHGTAEAGGFAISITSLPDDQGTVVYWPQVPGGYVCARNNDWYDCRWFAGSPSEFKQVVNAELGVNPDIWVGDSKSGPVRSVNILHDSDGNPAMAVTHHEGRSLSFTILNTASAFHTKGPITLEPDLDPISDLDGKGEISVERHDDYDSINMIVSLEGSEKVKLKFSARNVDTLISKLVELRGELTPPIDLDLPLPPRRDAAVWDPPWRTEISPIGQLPGVLLRLRHPGAGWQTYLLPPNEVENLGKWLTSQGPPAQDLGS